MVNFVLIIAPYLVWIKIFFPNSKLTYQESADLCTVLTLIESTHSFFKHTLYYVNHYIYIFGRNRDMVQIAKAIYGCIL